MAKTQKYRPQTQYKAKDIDDELFIQLSKQKIEFKGNEYYYNYITKNQINFNEIVLPQGINSRQMCILYNNEDNIKQYDTNEMQINKQKTNDLNDILILPLCNNENIIKRCLKNVDDEQLTKRINNSNNNILHLCAKYQNYVLFNYILNNYEEKAKYLLRQRNQNKEIPLQLIQPQFQEKFDLQTWNKILKMSPEVYQDSPNNFTLEQTLVSLVLYFLLIILLVLKKQKLFYIVSFQLLTILIDFYEKSIIQQWCVISSMFSIFFLQSDITFIYANTMSNQQIKEYLICCAISISIRIVQYIQYKYIKVIQLMLIIIYQIILLCLDYKLHQEYLFAQGLITILFLEKWMKQSQMYIQLVTLIFGIILQIKQSNKIIVFEIVLYIFLQLQKKYNKINTQQSYLNGIKDTLNILFNIIMVISPLIFIKRLQTSQLVQSQIIAFSGYIVISIFLTTMNQFGQLEICKQDYMIELSKGFQLFSTIITTSLVAYWFKQIYNSFL